MTSIRDLAISATFVALAVALGFALVHVPNVELVTLVVFASGYLLGVRRGLIVGLCSMGLFTTFNPLGVPVLPVALAQVSCMGICGWIGGASRRWLDSGTLLAKLVLLGLVSTLLYDLGTNTAMAISFGLTSKLISVLMAGLAFSFLHLVSNTVIFALAGPFLVRLGAIVRAGS
jgi:hypothetical protein